MKMLPIAVALAVLYGCASQSTPDSSTSGNEGSANNASAAPAPAPAPMASGSQMKVSPDKNSVYYAYDRSELTPEGKKLIEAHAQYLRSHPDTKVRIEGNADERGSAEYNLALGQRRADSVMNMMSLLGVKKDRMETVSYGKEKPKASGHSESAWSENRRSDIVYR